MLKIRRYCACSAFEFKCSRNEHSQYPPRPKTDFRSGHGCSRRRADAARGVVESFSPTPTCYTDYGRRRGPAAQTYAGQSSKCSLRTLGSLSFITRRFLVKLVGLGIGTALVRSCLSNGHRLAPEKPLRNKETRNYHLSRSIWPARRRG